jgi:hypothetical protein
MGDVPQELHQVMIDPLMKLDPVTVIGTELVVPAVAPDGESEVTVGPFTVNVRPLEATALTESETVTVAVPAVTRRVFGTLAMIEVAELVLTVSCVVFPLNDQFTMGVLATRLVPFMVRLRVACPAAAEEGFKDVRLGAERMVKGCVPGAATDPVATPTWAVPAEVSKLVGTVAVRTLVLVKVVGVNETGVPLQALHHVMTEEPLTKLEPFTVMITGFAVPATAFDGEIDVTPAPEMVNVTLLEDTPLTESTTVTVAEPAVVSKEEGMAATIEVAVVLPTGLRGVTVTPAVQLTTAPAVGKLVPVRVTLKPACPAVAVVWLSEVRCGPDPMVKPWVVGPVPVPLLTPIWALPVAVNKLAGTNAVSWVALTLLVASGVGLTQLLHHVAVDTPLINPVPVTVTETAVEPTGALEGEMDVTAGAAITTEALPDFALKTVSETKTVDVPAVVSRFAGMLTVMTEELIEAGESCVEPPTGPVQLTNVEAVGRLVPLIVRVPAVCPATKDELVLVMAGAAEMVKVPLAVEVFPAPAPFVTPTWTLPEVVVNRLIGIWAVSWVALVKLVLRLVGEPEQKLHQVTEEAFVKLVPFTVISTTFWVPAGALDGVSVVTVGIMGPVTVNVGVAEEERGDAPFALVTPTVAVAALVSKELGITAVNCVELI